MAYRMTDRHLSALVIWKTAL